MPRVLIIEDDFKMVEAIEKTLTLSSNYISQAVSDPNKALATAIHYKPDLILLDIKIPGGDGRFILKSLKKNMATQSIPVIFLTGMSSEGDKVLGLNLGAEDYVTKPFGAMELMARIQTVLRRYQPTQSSDNSLKIEGLALDPSNRMASLSGKPLKLQPKEFEILHLLASNPGKTLTRAFLIENTSSYGMPLLTRSLDTHIKNLRRKLGAKAKLIQTISKMGYRFESNG